MASSEHTSFRSDNIAGASPQIMAALSSCNEGVAIPYGGDVWTQRVEEQLARVFERKVGVLLNTGTAANSLALAAMTPLGQRAMPPAGAYPHR
jgi:threonine aldolase